MDTSFIIVSTCWIAGLGLVSAIVLAVAAKYLTVEEDPRIAQVAELLPGANCGGCGLAGCMDYARGIVLKGMPANLCAPGGAECTRRICAFMGMAAEISEPKAARVLCGGNTKTAKRKFLYNGIADCAAAAATAGGDKECPYGCLGYGSCARICPVNAIQVVDGLAVVDKARCISCGKCVNVCPRKIIKIVPAAETLHVLCSSKDKGPDVKRYCGVGCIGCRICTKFAGEAIVMDGFLALRDYSKQPPNDEAAAKCPGKCIVKG